jgi:hypothetical protein
MEIMTTNPQTPSDKLDQATQARLARLAAMPVDTSKLQARLRQAMPKEHAGAGRPMFIGRLMHWPAAVAAAILVAALVGVLFLTNAGASPALAAPAEMAQLHEHVMGQGAHTVAASDMDQVRREIAKQWSDGPAMPSPQAPTEHVMACCIHHVQGRKVACVLLQGKTPVTMVVARAADVQPAPGTPVMRGSHQYTTHRCDQINMVMTIRDDRYICLMGDLPQNELIDLGESLAF